MLIRSRGKADHPIIAWPQIEEIGRRIPVVETAAAHIHQIIAAAEPAGSVAQAQATTRDQPIAARTQGDIAQGDRQRTIAKQESIIALTGVNPATEHGNAAGFDPIAAIVRRQAAVLTDLEQAVRHNQPVRSSSHAEAAVELVDSQQCDGVPARHVVASLAKDGFAIQANETPPFDQVITAPQLNDTTAAVPYPWLVSRATNDIVIIAAPEEILIDTVKHE
jgi:hypothetical protein